MKWKLILLDLQIIVDFEHFTSNQNKNILLPYAYKQ